MAQKDSALWRSGFVEKRALEFDKFIIIMPISYSLSNSTRLHRALVMDAVGFGGTMDADEGRICTVDASVRSRSSRLTLTDDSQDDSYDNCHLRLRFSA